VLALVLALAACSGSAPRPAAPDPAVAAPPSYEAVLGRIAADIEALRGEYPQLAAFSARAHLDRERLAITYGYRTHEPRHRGGWSSGVPNPDDDGVWFHIDLHDPGSTAQIHTQPVAPRLRLGAKNVILLILEGARTRRLAPALYRILERRGARPPSAQ
jgi:hypothetical protein